MEVKTILQNKYKCPHENCNASFKRPSKLEVHLRKHTGERPFKCNEENCDKTYTNASHLRRHKKTFHEKNVENTICPYDGCGQVLYRYNLNKHIARKHSTKAFSFQCSHCQQGFKRKRQLQIHNFEHTNEKPFKCESCDLGFKTPKLLNQHKRYHKSYTCYCKEVFNHWSLYTLHKKQCIALRCTKCNKQLSNIQNLEDHMDIHKDKNERNVFRCDHKECRKFYFYEKNLLFHKRVDHGEHEFYKCQFPECKKLYKYKHDLMRHVKIRHLEIPSKLYKSIKNPRKNKGTLKTSIINKLIGISNIPVDNNIQTEDTKRLIEELINLRKEIIMKSVKNKTEKYDSSLNCNSIMVSQQD